MTSQAYSPAWPAAFRPARLAGAYEAATAFDRYLAAFETPPDAAWVAAGRSLFLALEDAGLLRGLDGLHLPAPTAQGFRINAVAPWIVATEVNSPSYTENEGYTGNGSTSYVDTGFNPAIHGRNFTQSHASMSVWVRTNATSATANDIGGRRSRILSRVDVSAVAIGNHLGALVAALGVVTSVGLTTWSRLDSGSVSMLKDGVSLSTQSIASAAPFGANFYICAYNDSTGGTAVPSGYSSRQVALAAWGAGRTEVEEAALYGALSDFMAAIA